MARNIAKLLEEKLQQNNQKHSQSTKTVDFISGNEYFFAKVDIIEPNPYQPRRSFSEDEINSLSNSISEVGLLEPILLRKVEDKYQIIAGERRWRAYKKLDRPMIPAIMMDAAEADMAVFALVENMNREDLSDYEIGIALRQIETVFPSKKKLAESLGINREDMYRYFAFEDLPAFIMDDLNINPRLLSRSAAADIRRVINQNIDSAKLNDIVKNAWIIFMQGKIDQTKLAGYISNKLLNYDSDLGEGSSLNLMRDGNKIGLVGRSRNHITIKLNRSIFNEEQEQEFRDLLEGFFSAKLC